MLFFFGVIGWYAYQKQETGWWGFTGFLLALIGAGLLIVNDVVNASSIKICCCKLGIRDHELKIWATPFAFSTSK